MAVKGAWLVSMKKLISSYRGGSSFFFKNDYFLGAHALSEIVFILYHSRLKNNNNNNILSSFVTQVTWEGFSFSFFSFIIINVSSKYTKCIFETSRGLGNNCYGDVRSELKHSFNRCHKK